jgi:hypothetical protein
VPTKQAGVAEALEAWVRDVPTSKCDQATVYSDTTFIICVLSLMANARRRLPLGHDHLLLDFFQFILQEEHDPTLDNH